MSCVSRPSVARARPVVDHQEVVRNTRNGEKAHDPQRRLKRFRHQRPNK